MILKNLLHSPEDCRHCETQSCESCSVNFSFKLNPLMPFIQTENLYCISIYIYIYIYIYTYIHTHKYTF